MTPEEKQAFIQALKVESFFAPSDATIEQLLTLGFELSLPAKTKFIEENSVNTNLYIQVNGLARTGYYEDKLEKTYGFSGAATFHLSPRGFYHNDPAYFFMESCMPLKVLVIHRENVLQFMKDNYEFCYWFSTISLGQYYSIETKLSIFTSTPSENYKRILNGEAKRHFMNLPKRPDITKHVSSRVLASYLGISPAYLSKIKKEMIFRNKTNCD